MEKARVYHQDPSTKTNFELTRFALKQMKDLGPTLIPSDKDSGFVLMKLSDVSAHDIISRSKSKSFWKWAKTVSVHAGIQELKKELLLDSSRFGKEGVIAQLQTNVKTHKTPGQVKPRANHSATKNPLVTLGKYVAWKLRYPVQGTSCIQLKSSTRALKNWSVTRMTGSSPLT